MGTTVTILEALPAILTGCDTEVANVVGRSFKKRGIDIRTGVTITGHKPEGIDDDRHRGGDDVSVDMVSCRSVAVANRGLVAEGTGSRSTTRLVVADGQQRTANPHVYAL